MERGPPDTPCRPSAVLALSWRSADQPPRHSERDRAHDQDEGHERPTINRQHDPSPLQP